MRDVLCDFCSAVLRGSAYDFPADDVQYAKPGISPQTLEPVEGAVGSWLACNTCAALIESGLRDELAKRCAETFLSKHRLPKTGYRTVLLAVRETQDLFWSARRGAPTRIGPEQLALIASDPPTIRERR